VQGERIGETVLPPVRRFDAPYLEFDPIALFQIVNESIEREQELKRVVGLAAAHFISCHDMYSVMLLWSRLNAEGVPPR
jgi:hypothetical protein